MAEIVYNKVTPEIIEAFKQIVPGKVYVKDEINEDYFHEKKSITEIIPRNPSSDQAL